MRGSKDDHRAILKDVLIPLIVAVIALPVGMAIESYKSQLEARRHLQSEQENQCDRSAAYLETMASALEAMVDDFKKGTVPRKSGALFNSTVEVLGEKAKRAVGGSEWNNLIDPLQHVAREAQQDLDPFVYEYFQQPDGKQKIDAWTVEAEHAIGELRARAAVLRAHLDSCQF